MSEQNIHPNKYSELRSMFAHQIDLYIALHQLKTENEEDLNKIYNTIKTELIDSRNYRPQKNYERYFIYYSL